MRKTKDFCKKIRDTKGTFHAKMGAKRTEMVDLKRTEGIREGGKNKQRNYTKKIFIIQITTMVLSLT